MICYEGIYQEESEYYNSIDDGDFKGQILFKKLTKFVDDVQGIGSKINVHFIKHIQGLFADALELRDITA